MLKPIRTFFRLLSIIIALGIGLFVLIFAGVIFFNSPPDKTPVSSNDAKIEDGYMLFEVKSGETADSVGRRLENAGAIKTRHFWYLVSRFGKEYLKAGTYRIEVPSSLIKIYSVLVNGEQLLIRVTIPEGVTIKKTALIFEEAGICGAEEFLAAASSREILDNYRVPGPTMEGYLYTDTYLLPLNYPATKVVSVMADTFYKRLETILNEGMSPAEINKRVIIASIVEREYRIPEEAGLMAGVFFNRLKINMALQSCATVVYVITEIQGLPHPEVLYNRDIEIKNPYNTYIRPGLPPGPISSPGETALRAAFNPVSSDYLYFRLTDENAGRHYFSRSLDDHIRAGALYVKGR